MASVVESGYDIVWQFMPDEWVRAQGAGAPGSLPYFVQRENRVRIGTKTSPPLDSAMLVSGVLFEWFGLLRAAPPTGVAHRERYLRVLLDRLKLELRAVSIERMILDFARAARRAHGPIASARMLLAGTRICRRSPRLRCALVRDAWRVMEEIEHAERDSACKTVIEAYREIDFTGMSPETVETVDYINAAALYLLQRRFELIEFLWRTAAKRIRSPKLKIRLLRMANGERLRFDDLRIPDSRGQIS